MTVSEILKDIFHFKRYDAYCELGFEIQNNNSFSIKIERFEGTLEYNGNRLAYLNQVTSTELNTGVLMPFTIGVSIPLSMAIINILAASTAAKQYDGAYIRGTLFVSVKGVTFALPIERPIGIMFGW
jgi:hypothetical protein